MAMQMGVCQVQSAQSGTSMSSSLVALTKPNGQTQFNATYFIGSATCAKGNGVTTQALNLGFNTTMCKKVAGTSLMQSAPTGAVFYSNSYATTVGFTSGTGSIQYTSAAGCVANTLTLGSMISVVSSGSLCTQSAPGSLIYNSPVVTACPAVSTTASTVYASTRYTLILIPFTLMIPSISFYV